jgi:hypothetical protein
MLTESNAIRTPAGHILYHDDADPSRLYILPSEVGVKRTMDGSAEFTLLFYQEDFPERGARLVAAFAPVFPEIDAEHLAELNLVAANVDGVAFTGGEVNVSCEGFAGQACIVSQIARGSFHVEISLSREEARLLRQLLRAGSETVRVRACLAYEVAREPLPARVRVGLRAVHHEVRNTLGSDALTGSRFCQLLVGMPPAALRVEPTGSALAADIPFSEDLARIVAPIILPRVASTTSPGVIFNTLRVTLLEADQVPDGELIIDLSRTRSWQSTWEGNWSLSGFYQQTLDSGHAAKYFPEVLSLPPVGNVDLLIENLLPVDGQCIDKVMVNVRYRRLGLLEEAVFETEFDRDSPPVARWTVQRIAMTDFSYRYHVQVRLAQEDPSHPGARLVPRTQQWSIARDPILRVGFESFPYALAHLRALPEVFTYVARVDIEIAPLAASDSKEVQRATLSAAHSSQWVTLDPSHFPRATLRWRPLLHSETSGDGQIVAGPWQVEDSLSATVTLMHVYPRQPIRIRAEAKFADINEVTGVICEVESGQPSAEAQSIIPDLTTSFSTEGTRDLILWPKSIFEQGFSFRYGIQVPDANMVWTNWRYQTEPKIEMIIEDEFYTTRIIRTTLKAPWSQRNGPDPSTRDPEIIFVELHLRTPQATGSQCTSFTFDKTNAGTEVRWKVRSRKDQQLGRFEVLALSADGRMLSFGPFEFDQEQLSIEIFVVRSGDTEPPEFGMRWS